MLTLIRKDNVTALVNNQGVAHFKTLTDSDDVKRCVQWAKFNKQVFIPVEQVKKGGK